MELAKLFMDAAKMVNDANKDKNQDNERTQKIINSLFELQDKYVKENETKKAKEILKTINQIQSERWENNKEELIEIFEKEGISLDDVLKEN